MSSSMLRGLVALTVASALLPTTVVPVAAQIPVQQTPEGVRLNFQNVLLGPAFTALGEAAGINVVLANIPETLITLRTAQPVPASDVAALIRSLAEANYVRVLDQPGFLLLQGPSLDAQLVEPRELYIYRLQHARSPLLAGTLQALFGGAIPPTGSGIQAPQALSEQIEALQQQGITVGAGGQPIAFQLAGGELEGDVLIVPDEITNSLLVRARAADWAVIQQAIQALDLRPLQVVIEVIIAEVQRSNELNVGVSFQASDATPAPDESTVVTLPAVEPTTEFTLDILRSGDIDVGVTLAALAATGNVQILSRPVIQAQNNQEARILVGSERPFVQVSQVLPTDQGARNEVIQYRDVGTSLTILPTINEDGYVNLLLTQEVSSATAETQFGAPVISTREATTQILARTGQTIVIGGLVDRQVDEVRSGIPLLKDIPVLGWLFGSTREAVSNSELFLFLTPYVVASDVDADLLRQEIEGNTDLLRELVPIRSILPPSLRDLVPDSVPADPIPGGGSPR